MVAIATAFREQGKASWGWFTFIFQMMVGYLLAMCTYNIGMFFTAGVMSAATIVSFAVIVIVLVLLFRPVKH